MNLIEQIKHINDQVNEKFSRLSSAQLNWKPEPSKWSIAQCLDHLIVSNKAYYPIFEKFLSHSYRLPFFQRLNPFKKLLGPLMLRFLGTTSKRKLNAPKIFQPSSSEISSSIVKEFLIHQQEMINYFRRLFQLDTKNLVLASPVSAMVTYSLADGLELLTVHEQRHFIQAENVLNHPNFPT